MIRIRGIGLPISSVSKRFGEESTKSQFLSLLKSMLPKRKLGSNKREQIGKLGRRG